MVSLFAGNVIGGTSYVGLERVCVAFNMADEALQDRASHNIEIMSQAHDPDDPRRVWWRSVDADGRESWTSINPGEFRTTLPEPPCEVRDLPAGMPTVSLRDMLEGAIASCEAVPPFTDRERKTLEAAKRLLARRYERVPTEMYQFVRSASNITEQAQYQAFIDDLYENYFVGFQCTIVDFSLAVIFVQLQCALSAHIEQDWRDDPAGYLRAYLRQMLADERTRAKTIETLLSISKSEFDAGRETIIKALDGTMGDMPRRLMMAYHRFFMVKAMLNSLEDGSVPRNKIQPDPIVSEEAIACTATGIHLGADFCVEHPDVYPLRLLTSCGAELPALRRKIRAQTSEVEPTFTRLFGQIIAAQALGHSEDPVKIAACIAELNHLNEEAVHRGDDFEWSWLDHALLNAHRRNGDTNAVRQFADRIARKLVVRTVLGREME
jgi:hypothetical protein